MGQLVLRSAFVLGIAGLVTSCTSVRLSGNASVSDDKARTVASVSVEGKVSLPPMVLYHGGSRKTLDEDIKAGTVPKAAWDRYVMGDETNFDLPRWRRGFYGAEEVLITTTYAGISMGRGGAPWTVRIHLAPECRQPAAVFNEYEMFTNEDTVFGSWLRSTSVLQDPRSAECIYKTGSGRSAWDPGPVYLISQLSENERNTASFCGDVVDRFFNENHIKIVLDGKVINSWYIRDRACIEKLDGSPDDWFDALVRQGLPFFNDDRLDEVSENFAAEVAFYLQILAEGPILENSNLAALQKLDLQWTERAYLYDKRGTELRGAAARKRYESGDPSDDEFVPPGYSLHWINQAALRCAKKGLEGAFRSKLHTHLSDLFYERLHADGRCKGKATDPKDCPNAGHELRQLVLGLDRECR